MFKFIDKLRKKPERKREAIVLAISFSIIFLIATFWITALVTKLRSGEVSIIPSNMDTEEFKKSSADIKNSWDSFMQGLGNVWNSGEATTTATTTTATVIDSSAQ